MPDPALFTSPELPLQAQHIGWPASETLARRGIGVVYAITSVGLYLRFDQGRMVFLSKENSRGPLSLNLKGDWSLLDTLQPGCDRTVETDGTALKFLGLKKRLTFSKAAIWKAVLPPARLAQDGWLDRWRATAASAISQKDTWSLVSGGLPRLAGLPMPDKAALDTEQEQQINDIRQAIQNGETDQLVQAMIPVLGLGPGLTPSGDDLVCGVLLAINRWGPVLAPQIDSQKLNYAMLAAASQKTTTLSINLVECAGLGQGNERLLFGLDGIMTGQGNPEEWARGFVYWGHTSGMDTFTGMSLVIRSDTLM